MDYMENINRFEALLTSVNRPGMDKLLAFIQKSDFYTAPASTKYHLSCEGGLLQHSLNVFDALESILGPIEAPKPGERIRYYKVAWNNVAAIEQDSVIIVSLLHDICKTYFYAKSTRNVKNEQTGKWEKAPYYTVDDKMPLGHGAKSAMIIKQYIDLTTPEMYAIWWHMGYTDVTDPTTAATLSEAITRYPLILALHTADMMAARFMESETENKAEFRRTNGSAAFYASDYADMPTLPDEPPIFEEATPLC